jgi:flagellar protein FlgJ
MAVDFPSDLVLDVARAADPASTRTLEARLNTATSAAGPASGVAEAAGFGNHLSRVVQGTDAKEAGKEFESLLVQNMIEDMMTDTGEAYFGGGFAGDVWKSMMAEQIAAQVVKGADFGFASKVANYVVRQGDTIEPLRGVNDTEAMSQEVRMQEAARRGTQEISRDFIRDMMSPVNSATES